MWSATACTTDANCNHPGASSEGPCVIAGNRDSANSCFFEGIRLSQTPLSMPGPPDNDLDEDFACENDDTRFCIANGDCGSCENDSSLFCRDGDECGKCQDGITACQIQSDCNVVSGPAVCDNAAANTTCQTGEVTNDCIADDVSGNVDEYVYPNGPIRN